MGVKVKPFGIGSPKAGQQPEWSYKFPEGFILKIDTREQEALFLDKPPSGLHIVREVLSCGDYSIVGYENKITVEKKSVLDLLSCLGQQRDRFKVEIEHMATFERKWIVVLGSEEELLSFQVYSKMHPNSVRASICSIEVRNNIHFHYQPKKSEIERWILDRFIKYWNVKHELPQL